MVAATPVGLVVKPRELLLAACLLCAVVASIALVRAAEWTRAHWTVVVVAAVVLVLVPAYLWHRRQMELYRERWALGEGWGKLPGFARHDVWACGYCQALVGGLDQAEAHDDPTRSACAAFRRYLEAREDTQREQTYVDVLNTPGRGWPAVLPDQEDDRGER